MLKANSKIKRQAVVIIHGMGEQRPMDTLRSFVVGIKKYLENSDVSEANTKVRSQPDPVSETYETRRLSLSASRNRPITDFYEFYWAHNMRNTTFANISAWLWRLLTAPPSKIPPRLRILWYTVWVFLLVCAGVTSLILITLGVEEVRALFAGLLALPFVFSIISVLEKYFMNLFFSTAGDAARYFSPIPSNISERHKIRHQGISFLEKLHNTVGDKKYDRIVVVAHSLGTAVGYDLLKLLWTQYNKTFIEKSEVDQSLLKDLNNACRNIDSITLKEFQNLQHRFWLQQKETGNKWLITDFVTLGAAVTSVDYFLLRSEPFSDLIEQREFPVCPPVLDETNTIAYESEKYSVGSTFRTIKVLHHAAMFAVTRWTNIYFASDFVGGAATRIFGKGVRDVSIKRKSLWFLPGGHTDYWNHMSKGHALKEIVSALRLRYDENPKMNDAQSDAQKV